MDNLAFRLLALVLVTFSLAVSADENFDEQLANIDKIRSSNNKQFQVLLSEFKSNVPKLNKSQKHYYKYLLAYDATFRGDLKSAVRICKELLASDANNTIKFRANLTLLNSLVISKNWSEGMSYLTTNINLLPTIDDKELNQLGVLGVALAYNLYGQYELSLDYISDIKLTDLSLRNRCLVQGFRVEALSKLNQITKSSQTITSALTDCEKAGEFVMSNMIKYYNAWMYLNNEQSAQALQLLLKAKVGVEKANYKWLTNKVFVAIALAYLDQNDVDKAKSYASAALQQMEGLETTEPASRAYYVLHKVAEINNEIKDALKFHKLYVDSERAYLGEVQEKAVAFQLAQHKAIQQQNEIELLNNQNALLKTQSNLSKAEANNSRLISVMAVSIAVLIGFFGFRSWQTQRRLKTLSEFDYLTNVYNRRHFMTLADYALKLGNRSRHVVSCITLDLDNFKHVNDTYGHGVGDWVLKKTAKSIQDCTRENDIFARLGGEEFILLLPSCDLSSAVSVAEKCIQALNQIDTAETGHDFKVTGSLGLTTSTESGYDMEILMAHSDEAMYYSKQNGKNRFTAYSDMVKLQRENNHN